MATTTKIERYQIRLARYEEQLALFLAAQKAILEGAQSYTIGSRQLSRASLTEIDAEISKYEKLIDELENLIAGGAARKAFAVVPRDI